MNNDEKYLSKLLQSKNMGIDLYNKYLDKLPVGNVKREVEGFLDEHLRHKKRIENMLSVRQMEVNGKVGLQGKMAETFESAKLIFINEPKNILKDIYKGEIMEVTNTMKYLHEFSSEIKPDIEKLIQENQKRIEKIHELLDTI